MALSGRRTASTPLIYVHALLSTPSGFTHGEGEGGVGGELCRINGELVCDDSLRGGGGRWLPGNAAASLQHNGDGGKRTPTRLRSILSRDGVTGARGYGHVVPRQMDSRGEIRSAEEPGERRTVTLLSYFCLRTRARRNHLHPQAVSRLFQPTHRGAGEDAGGKKNKKLENRAQPEQEAKVMMQNRSRGR